MTQEGESNVNRINAKKPTPRHIIIKLLKTKDKDKLFRYGSDDGMFLFQTSDGFPVPMIQSWVLWWWWSGTLPPPEVQPEKWPVAWFNSQTWGFASVLSLPWSQLAIILGSRTTFLSLLLQVKGPHRRPKFKQWAWFWLPHPQLITYMKLFKSPLPGRRQSSHSHRLLLSLESNGP